MTFPSRPAGRRARPRVQPDAASHARPRVQPDAGGHARARVQAVPDTDRRARQRVQPDADRRSLDRQPARPASGAGVRELAAAGRPPTGTDQPGGAAGFASLGVAPALVDVLARRGIHSPTPVQGATVPDALAGRDVCGKAPTGSGKTIAFGVPLASLVSAGRPGRPRGLVLVPTRELATQVADELAPLLATRRLRLATFFGGVGFGPQLRALRSGVDVAVACPGRLQDLRDSGHLALDDVDLVVVDEADRMADMGFLPSLRRILDGTSADRQTLLFSATLDGAVDSVVRQYLADPVRHEVVASDDDLGRMSHRFVAVDQSDRVAACASVLAASPASVVFVRTRHGADRLARQLGQSGIQAAAIHGNRTQPQRQRALDAFRDGSVRALVATDVAARGIHVDDVGCVVHFDLPAEAADYVHRSGRTARAGATGNVVALVLPDQHGAARTLVRNLALEADMDGIEPAGPASGPASPSPAGNRSGGAGRDRRAPAPARAGRSATNGARTNGASTNGAGPDAPGRNAAGRSSPRTNGAGTGTGGTGTSGSRTGGTGTSGSRTGGSRTGGTGTSGSRTGGSRTSGARGRWSPSGRGRPVRSRSVGR